MAVDMIWKGYYIMMVIEWYFLAGFFMVALLYASVGHGGASGYLALMSFFCITPELMSASALILNLLVSGLAFFQFHKKGYFSWNLTWPFLVMSIPAAFLGGLIKINPQTYTILLMIILVYASIRLMMTTIMQNKGIIVFKQPSIIMAIAVGTVIGLISGIVGVGGGIFLSPILILLCWADAKSTSATSACFIWCNSLAGLAGRLFSKSLVFENTLQFMPIVCVAFIGGWLGSYLGANKFTSKALRVVLALVLMLAVGKMVQKL